MKKLLALVLALVMSMSLVTISNAAFKDADKIDYKEAVDVMNAVGVFIGDEKGNFNAKENLTREQAAELCRLAQQDANDVSDSDVLAAMAANSDDVYAAAAKEDTLSAETEAWDVYRYNIVIYVTVDGRDVSRSLTPMGYCTRMQSFIGSLDFTNTTTVDTEEAVS